MRARLRAWFDGVGVFAGTAALLLAFALLAVVLEVQSPDLILWTGHRVAGTEQGGIVYYRWHGQNYTLDARGYGSSKAVSVYLDPNNPANAMTDNPVNRAAVVLLVGLPFAGAVTLLAFGLSREYLRRRREMRRVPTEAAYGEGLDPEFVARRLRAMRRDHKDP